MGSKRFRGTVCGSDDALLWGDEDARTTSLRLDYPSTLGEGFNNERCFSIYLHIESTKSINTIRGSTRFLVGRREVANHLPWFLNMIGTRMDHVSQRVLVILNNVKNTQMQFGLVNNSLWLVDKTTLKSVWDETNECRSRWFRDLQILIKLRRSRVLCWRQSELYTHLLWNDGSLPSDFRGSRWQSIFSTPHFDGKCYIICLATGNRFYNGKTRDRNVLRSYNAGNTYQVRSLLTYVSVSLKTRKSTVCVGDRKFLTISTWTGSVTKLF